MKTEQGLESLLGSGPANRPDYVFVRNPERVAFMDDLKSRIRSFSSEGLGTPEDLNLKPVSALYGADEEDMKRSITGPEYSPAARRLIDEGGVPEALLLLALNASRESDDQDDPISPLDLIAESVNPDVDYSSFEEKFAFVRINEAIGHLRGIKAGGIANLMHQIPEIMKSGDRMKKNRLGTKLMNISDGTGSEVNKSAIGVGVNILKGRPDRASSRMAKIADKNGWTERDQAQQDLSVASSVLLEINEAADFSPTAST